MRCVASIALLMMLAVAMPGSIAAQEKPAEKPDTAPKKPVFVSPYARLNAAKTAAVRNARGSDIPFNVISSGLEGWGRFNLVDSPSEADIIIEVSSPSDDKDKGGTRVGSGRGQDSSDSINDIEEIRLAVYDAHTRVTLWSASERPKGGFRDRTREDHMVEAASHLLTKFRQRLEPPPPKP